MEEQNTMESNSRPKYVGLLITPKNRMSYIRKYGAEEVGRQEKMFKAFMKGKESFIWRGQIYPVMSDKVLSQNKFDPTGLVEKVN